MSKAGFGKHSQSLLFALTSTHCVGLGSVCLFPLLKLLLDVLRDVLASPQIVRMRIHTSNQIARGFGSPLQRVGGGLRDEFDQLVEHIEPAVAVVKRVVRFDSVHRAPSVSSLYQVILVSLSLT